jgi:hypothetical protein
MKRKINSLLVSILFFPIIVISQALAGLVLLYIVFMIDLILKYTIASFSPFPFNVIGQVLSSNFALVLFEGCFAGYIAAFAVALIYKNYHLLYTMIIPSILTILVVGGGFILPILYNKSFIWLDIISNTLIIVIYYYVLKARVLVTQ